MNSYFKPILLCTLIVAVVGIVYQPALSGGFIFDDFNNLRLLGIMEGEWNWDNLKAYLSSQKSGPVGRPIASLSFLMDANNWPVESERPFKITNLALHLINTILLFILMVKVFGLFDSKKQDALWLAFIACFVWAVHPFFVSTTMYVVQRMAMLPATFTLIGMLFYLKGRLVLKDRPWQGLILMVIGVWGCTLLAVLSKENGVLLLVHILLFEYLLLSRQLKNPLPKKHYYGLIVFPVILFIAALVYKFSDHTSSYDVRNFDLYERILTQSRMLFKYLYYLWVPDYLTEGVFNDGIVISKSVLQPITTLYSLIGLLGLLFIALFCRNRSPLVSFALLFYFAGHVIESTYIPLELYFEHRNYLPAMFMFIPVSLLVLKLKNQPKLFYIIPVLIIFFLSFITMLRSNVWGNNLMLHYETARKFPESARAANTTASLFAWERQYDEALEMLEYGIKNHPKIQLRLNRVAVLCELERVEESDLKTLLDDINNTDFVKDDLTAYRDFLRKLIENDCYQGLGKEYVQNFLDGFKNNNLFKSSQTARKFYYYQNATIQAKLFDYDASLESFKMIIKEVSSLGDDPVFKPTALTAIDYLHQLDTVKGNELANYYEDYCLQNFTDCDSIFINELREKIKNEGKNIIDNSSKK